MQHRATSETTLHGVHVLVVEDDFLISMELSSILSAAGAEVVGPSRSVADALALVDQREIGAAILDVRLGRETVAPVARELSHRKVPFIFYTGQANSDPIRREWPDSQVISKPAPPQALVAALASLSDTAHAK